MVRSPFKFLDSYTKEDRDIFFGRDREIEEMYRRVYESKTLVLYGISGTGKTSLINCGLANKFEKTDWFPITIRRAKNATENFITELHKIAISLGTTPPPAGEKRTGLSSGENDPVNVAVGYLQSVFREFFVPIYLIFDQFEELFVFGDHEEREEFIRVIKGIIDSSVQCRFIFSIREEYLAGMTEFEEDIPEILVNRMRIEKMTRKNAIEVIEGPCRVQGIKVEEGFSNTLLDKLNPKSNEVELTYLQVFLDKIFRLATTHDGSRSEPNDIPRSGINDDSPLGGSNDSKPSALSSISFTLPLLEKIGDVSDLLGSFLEEQVSALDDPDSGLAILKTFVSLEGTRKQITEDEISESARTFGKNIGGEALKDPLQKFINLRILRDKDENGRYELRHDSLASKIFEKITLVEKELLEVRELIENAYRKYESRNIYLSQEDLNYIAPYEDKLILHRRLETFIEKSKKEVQKARNRRRNIAAAAAIVLIIILSGFAIWALFERSKAVRQTKIAEEQRVQAIEAQEEAEIARSEAESEATRAEQALESADSLRVVAEHQRNLSEQQRNYAEAQRNEAFKAQKEAEENRQLAVQAQTEAERSAEKVQEVNRQAMFQLYLFNGKEFANKSLILRGNDVLRALLALKAYDLVNYGYENYNAGVREIKYDTEILEALQKSYQLFESDAIAQGEITSIETKKDRIAFCNDKIAGRIQISELKPQGNDKLPGLSTILTIDLPAKSIIPSISFDSEGTHIACGTSNGEVILVTIREDGNEEVNSLYKHDGRILSLILIPGKEWLISSSNDRAIKVWDLTSGRVIQNIPTEAGDNFIHIQDNMVLFTSHDQIFGWDLNELDRLPEPVFKTQNSRTIDGLVFSDKYNRLFALVYDELLVLQPGGDDWKTFISRSFSEKHPGRIQAGGISPDNNWLASASFDGTILLWDLSEFGQKDVSQFVPIRIGKENQQLRSLAFSTQGNYLLYGSTTDLYILPLDIELLYEKLRYKMGNRTLEDRLFDYYKRGDIVNPVILE